MPRSADPLRESPALVDLPSSNMTCNWLIYDDIAWITSLFEITNPPHARMFAFAHQCFGTALASAWPVVGAQ